MWTTVLLCQVLLAWSAVAKDVLFIIDLTWEVGAPDGFSREMILVNGTSPGPALILDEGDNVKFLARNHMHHNVTIHFHGITQLHTPWSDGVPGVSQTPILPHEEFLYQWTADEYGTYWYHGHYLSDISDGLYGPIHINPKPGASTPYSLIDSSETEVAAIAKAATNPHLVTISDWQHLDSAAHFQAQVDSGTDLFCSNSILVNGRGKVSCPPIEELMSLASPPALGLLNGRNVTAMGCTPPDIVEIAGNFEFNLDELPAELAYSCNPTENAPTIFHVDSAQRWVSFNFILAASVQVPIVSIDGHELWIYEADGHFIEPELVDGVHMESAQRYSALVKLKENPEYDAYTMRFSNVGANQILFATSLLSYKPAGEEITIAPDTLALFTRSGAPVNPNVRALVPDTIKPYPPVKPAPYANATHILNAGRHGAAWRWTLGGADVYPTHLPDSAIPLLSSPDQPVGVNPNVTIRTLNDTWVDIVVLTQDDHENPLQPPHSFHKHSNKAFIIGRGVGVFNYSSVAEAIEHEPESFNLEDPPLRDSFVSSVVLPAQPTWVAIRYHSSNPGAFIMHCHIQIHFAGGMGMVILDGVDAWPEVPPEYGVGGNGLPIEKPEEDGHGGYAEHEKPWKKGAHGRPWGRGHGRADEDYD